MQATFAKFPDTLLQFEDFSSDKASTILSRYREQHLCFNDDIQGTGATVLAGVLGALRQQGKPPEALRTLKVVVVGAGSAGIGVAQSLQQAMVQAGAADTEAAANFFVYDQDAGCWGRSGCRGMTLPRRGRRRSPTSRRHSRAATWRTEGRWRRRLAR